MPFTFVCLTNFILQNEETRNHPHPPKNKNKKQRKKITRSHVPGAVASGDLVRVSGCRNTGGRRRRGCLPDPFAVRGDRSVPDDAGD